jgi:hypothetical protein
MALRELALGIQELERFGSLANQNAVLGGSQAKAP